jgi:hypothetical protein
MRAVFVAIAVLLARSAHAQDSAIDFIGSWALFSSTNAVKLNTEYMAATRDLSKKAGSALAASPNHVHDTRSLSGMTV